MSDLATFRGGHGEYSLSRVTLMRHRAGGTTQGCGRAPSSFDNAVKVFMLLTYVNVRILIVL